MEEANLVLPMMSRADDFVDKSSGSVDETEEFPERFSTYLQAELNWSRLEAGGGESGSTGWVFWDRQDDTLPVSDFESVNVTPNFSPEVKDKIRVALGRIILHPRYGQSLVQFWAPSRTLEGRTLLIAQNQPFGLGKVGRSAWGLCEYRMKSVEYQFYGDIRERGEEELLGLPGRVFFHRLPESAPDVQYYSPKEYPQCNDASHFKVRASWALPVFDFSDLSNCAGVLEFVSADNAITDWQDKSFLDSLDSALMDQRLQCFNVYNHTRNEMECEDEALTTAFHELSCVLKSVYERHKLPLALTWVLCNNCDKLLVGRRLFEDGEYLGAFKANDDHLVNFLNTSTGYHLWQGLYVAEMVTGSTSMLYCSDVTQFTVAEYPLVPFARQCKLSGCITISLKSSCTGDRVYILEFFLPTNSKDNANTLTTVSAILGTMKANSNTFKLASGEELGEVLPIKVFNFQNGRRLPYEHKIQASLELLKNGGLTLSVIGVDDGMDVISAEQNDKVATISEGDTTKTQEGKRKRIGVSLEDILRFSQLIRKDAARELKVSESTLKCICRKYGIHRWPPRYFYKEEAFPLPLPNAGDTVHLDSPEELELDATTLSEVDTITTEKRRREKTGVQIEISLENVLQDSEIRLDDAARGLNVSTIDKVAAPQPSRDAPACNIDKVATPQPSCVVLQEGISQLTSDMPSNQASDGRDYLVHLGPPQNVNKFGAPQPLHVEHEEEISLLTSDRPSNQVSASVACMKPHDAAFQEMEMVTIKATYLGYTMRFPLSMSSGIKELEQQVAKRLPAGNYFFNYEDEDGDLVLIACDEDVHACIKFFKDRDKKTVRVVILSRS